MKFNSDGRDARDPRDAREPGDVRAARNLNVDDRALDLEREMHGRRDSATAIRRDRELDAFPASAIATEARQQMDRWEQEQLFEEDVRAVLQMLRPNRRQRLLGWSEHRTGGAHFRVTVSWDRQADEIAAAEQDPLVVPKMADVIESLLVGSARHQDDLLPSEEFALYRDVLHEVHRRLDEMQACYE